MKLTLKLRMSSSAPEFQEATTPNNANLENPFSDLSPSELSLQELQTSSSSKQKRVKSTNSLSFPTSKMKKRATMIAASSSTVTSDSLSKTTSNSSLLGTVSTTSASILNAEAKLEQSPSLPQSTAYATTIFTRKLPPNIGDKDGLFGEYMAALIAARTYTRQRSWKLLPVKVVTRNGGYFMTEAWCTNDLEHVKKMIEAQNQALGFIRGKSNSKIEHQAKRKKKAKPSSFLPKNTEAGEKVERIKQHAHTHPSTTFTMTAAEALKVLPLNQVLKSDGVWTCTYPGCTKTFNDKTNWRRHVNGHIRYRDTK